MEQMLGYIVFGIHWPVLVIGSIWIWLKIAGFAEPSRTFLNIVLGAFYVRIGPRILDIGLSEISMDFKLPYSVWPCQSTQCLAYAG